MKRTCIAKYVILGLTILGGVAGCGTSYLRRVDKDAAFQPRLVHKALIVCISRTPQIRQLLENEFARQWKHYGVQAVASYTLMPPDLPLEKATIKPLAQDHEFDAVLVTRLAGVHPIDTGIGGKNVEVKTSTGTHLTEYYQAVVASPEYAGDYQLAVVTANVYDVVSEKLVWAGTTQTLVTQGVPAALKNYVGVILKTLYRPR